MFLGAEKESQGKKLKPVNEVDAIADIMKRVDEIQEELKLEYAKREGK